ncbi:MAG: RNA methyltransferase [Lachnospiraceae bacterium]|nr:RNA methyltransferase [Lachnospiraceae bacterium]
MIESSSNARIKNISALMKKSRLRKETGFFIAEGPRMVFETPGELLQEIYVSESFVTDERWISFCDSMGLREDEPGKAELFRVTDQVMRSVSDTVTPQGVLAVVRQPHYEPEELLGDGTPYLLVLERLQDPGNMGTILRTAEGAGVSGIIMSSDSVDIFSPKVVRATMGSLYRVPFLVSDDLIRDISHLRSRGIRFYATHPLSEKRYFEEDYTRATGFAIGNEGSGLSHELSDICDERITIPMEGQVESLNAAMATGILLYEGLRQRKDPSQG